MHRAPRCARIESWLRMCGATERINLSHVANSKITKIFLGEMVLFLSLFLSLFFLFSSVYFSVKKHKRARAAMSEDRNSKPPVAEIIIGKGKPAFQNRGSSVIGFEEIRSDRLFSRFRRLLSDLPQTRHFVSPVCRWLIKVGFQ